MAQMQTEESDMTRNPLLLESVVATSHNI
jgi:hypothetical protein